MIVKKEIKSYEDYVEAQNNRGGIDDSTLHYNNIINTIFDKHQIGFDDNILDIGTRNGIFVSQLHDKGYKNVYGTDISVAAFENLWPKLSENVRAHLALEDAQKSISAFGKTYKFISMSHVFEHMYDIDSVFTNIKEVLEPDGVLYVVIPKENNTEHRAHYLAIDSLDSFAELFMANGFEILGLFENVNRFYHHELQIIVKLK
jgi:2-polyprenyl-3-methyl-5-hydroxy-6-metoxy-1,4-benzoquinol methylase